MQNYALIADSNDIKNGKKKTMKTITLERLEGYEYKNEYKKIGRIRFQDKNGIFRILLDRKVVLVIRIINGEIEIL